MSELYRCGKCGSIYEEDELINHYTCGCGYVFGQDKWKMITPVRIKQLKAVARVISDYLETDWNDELEVYYQTSIISDLDFVNVWNHKTQAEAEVCHRKVVNALFNGKFEALEGEVHLDPQTCKEI